MSQISNKMLLKHSILLFKRKWSNSLFKLLPSIISTNLFAQIYLTSVELSSDKKYILIYFFIALSFIIIISSVIYFREAIMELSSFNYLIISGLRKSSVGFIILFRWFIMFLIGYIIGFIFFVFFNFSEIKELNLVHVLKLALIPYIMNLLLLVGVQLAIFKFDTSYAE